MTNTNTSTFTLNASELNSASVRAAFMRGFAGFKVICVRGSAEYLAFRAGRTHSKMNRQNCDEAFDSFISLESYWSRSAVASVRSKLDSGLVVNCG
jgi:hypothetical protein